MVQRRRPKRAEVVQAGEALTLAQFIRHHWHVVEARELIWGEFLDLQCDFLTALQQREFRRAILNVPPRFLKSTVANVMLPAWVWGEKIGPHGEAEQFLHAAYGDDLTKRDSEQCRKLIQSQYYQSRYPHVSISPH